MESKTRALLSSLLLLLTCVAVACSGPQGPQGENGRRGRRGPPGPRGESGPPGPPISLPAGDHGHSSLDAADGGALGVLSVDDDGNVFIVGGKRGITILSEDGRPDIVIGAGGSGVAFGGYVNIAGFLGNPALEEFGNKGPYMLGVRTDLGPGTNTVIIQANQMSTPPQKLITLLNHLDGEEGFWDANGTLRTKTIEVSAYVQLGLTSAAPPTTDCDESSEHGRMKVDPTAGTSLLYICTADGWVSK